MPGVPISVTPRAVEVLRRALHAGRLDPAKVGIRVSLGRGIHGEEIRTSFVEGPEPGDETIDAGGIRVFVPAGLARRGAALDVADDHDRIILRPER
jgi:Fe-S cluster assembly iron-binding protein IscA